MARRKRQVQIVVDVKAQKALRAIRTMGRQNQTTFRKMRRDISHLNRSWRRMQENIRTLNAALGIMSRVFGGASRIVRGFITLMEESASQRSGINQLRMSLQSLGSVDVPHAMQAIEAFAAQQQRTTRYGDDQTRAVVANMATVLHGTEVTAAELTSLAGLVQDVMERRGTRLRATATAVARAYVGQVEALNEILPAQRELLTLTLSQEGATAASAEAMSILEEEFRGASAGIDDQEQALANLGNTWGDFREQLGDAISEAAIQAGTMGDLQMALDDLITLTAENGPQLVTFLADVATAITSIAEAMTSETARVLFSATTPWWALVGAARDFHQGMDRGAVSQPGRVSDESRFGPIIFSTDDEPDPAAARRRQRAERAARLEELRAQQQAESGLRDAAAAAEAAHRETERMSAVLKHKIEDDLAALRLARYEASVIWSEAVADSKVEAAEAIDSFTNLRETLLELWGEMGEQLPEALADATADATEAMSSGIIDGLQTAEDAFRMFGSTLPRIMGDSAQDGADRMAAVFQFLGQAAQIAATAGVVAKGATSFLPGLSQFFSLAAASFAFASAMGRSGGGGAGARTPTRGAVSTEAADVLVGQRPEAARGGQARVINFQIGQILNNDASRKDLMEMWQTGIALGEVSIG